MTAVEIIIIFAQSPEENVTKGEKEWGDYVPRKSSRKNTKWDIRQFYGVPLLRAKIKLFELSVWVKDLSQSSNLIE